MPRKKEKQKENSKPHTPQRKQPWAFWSRFFCTGSYYMSSFVYYLLHSTFSSLLNIHWKHDFFFYKNLIMEFSKHTQKRRDLCNKPPVNHPQLRQQAIFASILSSMSTFLVFYCYFWVNADMGCMVPLPTKIYPSPNPWSLWMWPYLEIESWCNEFSSEAVRWVQEQTRSLVWPRLLGSFSW